MPEDIEELMKKVSLLEIKARRLSLETFSGEYHTTFKGQGLDFEDFREYQHGDEANRADGAGGEGGSEAGLSFRQRADRLRPEGHARGRQDILLSMA